MCEQNIVKTQNCKKSPFDLIVEIHLLPVVQYSLCTLGLNLKLLRTNLRPKGSDLRDGRVYQKPEKADLRLERADIRSERAILTKERADFRLKKNDLGLHSADLRPLRFIKQQVGGQGFRHFLCLYLNDIIPLRTIQFKAE